MKLKTPKISVIITCFNSEKFLKKSIQSVLNQSYKDFELIIVDDCSSDLTKKIILDHKNKDKRIKTSFIRKNSGTASIPRNLGAKISKGEYLAFLDSDDIWIKDKLKIQIKNISKSTILSFSSSNYIDENSNKIYPILQKFRRVIQEKIFNQKLSGLFAYNPVILSSVIIKKSVFLKFQFDETKSLVGIEDLDLWLRIFDSYSENIMYEKENLVLIRR